MTREKEILSAARDYIGRSMLSSPSYVIHFENGAKWADEHPVNVWHDVNEEPKINEDVVLYDCCGNFITEFFDDSVTWRNIVLYYKATMWAYADDLLPKRDKK